MAQTETHNLKGNGMTITYDDIDQLVTLAGPSLMWDGVTGSDRPSNKYPGKGTLAGLSPRQGYKAWLIAEQGGVCPHCANRELPSMERFPMLADVCHVVGSGPKRKGFVVRNNYAGHSACNTAAARSSLEGEAIGSPIAVARYVDSIYANTETNEHGYRLILGLGDFRRPELIPTEWPVTTMGQFAQFDSRA